MLLLRLLVFLKHGMLPIWGILRFASLLESARESRAGLFRICPHGSTECCPFSQFGFPLLWRLHWNVRVGFYGHGLLKHRKLPIEEISVVPLFWRVHRSAGQGCPEYVLTKAWDAARFGILVSPLLWRVLERTRWVLQLRPFEARNSSISGILCFPSPLESAWEHRAGLSRKCAYENTEWRPFLDFRYFFAS